MLSLRLALSSSARRKVGPAMRSAGPATCTRAEVNAGREPNPSIVPMAPSRPMLAVSTFVPPFQHCHERDNATLKKVDLFDLLSGPVQQVVGEENHLAQMWREQREVVRRKRGEKSVANLQIVDRSHASPMNWRPIQRHWTF